MKIQNIEEKKKMSRKIEKEKNYLLGTMALRAPRGGGGGDSFPSLTCEFMVLARLEGSDRKLPTITLKMILIFF